jgi:hypothetical protein
MWWCYKYKQTLINMKTLLQEFENQVSNIISEYGNPADPSIRDKRAICKEAIKNLGSMSREENSECRAKFEKIVGLHLNNSGDVSDSNIDNSGILSGCTFTIG